MASEQNTDLSTTQQDSERLEREKRVSELFDDGEARELMIQRLKDSGHVAASTPTSGAGSFMFPSQPGGFANSNSAWPTFPMQFPFVTSFPPFWGPMTTAPSADQFPNGSTSSLGQTPPASASLLGQPPPGSASSSGRPGLTSSSSQVVGEEGDDEDRVSLLGEEEAQEFAVFDPTVSDNSTWDAGEIINAFLEKHFNREVKDDEREAIMQDFPKPSCQVLNTPKLDEEIKKQIRKTGKDPHYGAERTLYDLQGQLLDMAGPLTCLWADLTSSNAEVNPQEVILLIQRVLVLLGSASHHITQERRKVAWSRVNPSTVSLLREDPEDGKKESTLFGGGFLERAAKRLEEEKTLVKVTGNKTGMKPQQKRQQDPNDLRRFLEKGPPAKYGGRRTQRHKPYTQQPGRKTFRGKGRKNWN